MGRFLGILQQPWQAFFEQRRPKTDFRTWSSLLKPSMRWWLNERLPANEKDWKRADEIRQQLEKDGILLEDKADGTHWKVAT
jgi:cysteinyl-tRNA synthetase